MHQLANSAFSVVKSEARKGIQADFAVHDRDALWANVTPLNRILPDLSHNNTQFRLSCALL